MKGNPNAVDDLEAAIKGGPCNPLTNNPGASLLCPKWPVVSFATFALSAVGYVMDIKMTPRKGAMPKNSDIPEECLVMGTDMEWGAHAALADAPGSN